MAKVIVNRVTVSYNKGKTIAVNDVSFQVEDGSFCVLLGPSGCGKTTILYTIAGLIRPDQGEIQIGEQIVTSTQRGIFVRPQDRNIAMVFQEYALYPNLTVRDNLAFPLECRRLNRKEIEAKVQEVAEMLGIQDLLDRRPAQLSGGQRQRVALGRALVRNPSVFLLDEPLGNLDAQLRIQVRYELRRIQRQLGATMIYVTHDQVEAMTLADQIVLLRNGKVEQLGSPQQLYEEPRDLFVATFIGSPPMNLLEAKVLRNEAGVFFECPAFRVSAAELGISLDLLTEETVILGMRPSDLTCRPSSPSDLGFEAQVDLVEPMGDSSVVHAFVESKKITAKCESSPSFHETRIKLYITPKKIHVFLPTGAKVRLKAGH
jgi:multiple sugar transport system ATP-binding protein